MITDLFALKCSEEFNIQNNQTIRVNLGLKTSLYPPRKMISGKVSHCGHPLRNATVVVLEAHFNPVTYTRTDDNGIYLIAGLNSQLYGLTATAPDFTVSDIIFLSLLDCEIKIANIELKNPNRRVFCWCSRLG
jgi:hypothetical protein